MRLHVVKSISEEEEEEQDSYRNLHTEKLPRILNSFHISNKGSD